MGVGSRGSRARRARARTRAGARRPRAAVARAAELTAAETAWLAAAPAALLGVLAIAVLGPPLGHALLAPEQARFWQEVETFVRPEPAEQGRYLVALAIPLLLAALTVAGVRARKPRLTQPAAAKAIVAIQAAGIAFVALCLLRQQGVFGSIVPPPEFAPPIDGLFTWRTLLVAAVASVALLAVLRRPSAWDALARLTRETPARRVAGAALALVLLVVWLLHAFNTEGTIGLAQDEVRYNVAFTFDETYAVLDGRSPLVNFAAQYGSLWPYAFAAAMSVLGRSLGVWIALALSATAAGMLGIYDVLRRAAGSSLRGLLLFAPLLATSFLRLEGTRANRWTFANYFGTFPMRYAGPALLAWLVARHLAGERPRRALPLFLAAGLVVLNNSDAGSAALGATLAALLWGGVPLTRAALRRLALEAAAGVLGAFALLSALTLARAGSLPHLALLVRYARLFARTGFAMYPMPMLGLHIAIYLTYVAAIGVATVRAIGGERDRLLTGMLAWSGVFGLGAGAYYAGRSTPDDLPAMLFPWAFALALLSIPALGSLRGASWRRPPLAAAACLFGLLAAACSLAQTPTPWEQLHRLRRTSAPILAAPAGQRLVAAHTHRGETVAILQLLGHRIGANLGLHNVSPYSNSESMPTAEQLDELLAALRRAGAHKIFLETQITSGAMVEALSEDGFTRRARQHHDELWSDEAR